MEKKTISVVVPTYNSRETLDETCKEILKTRAAFFSHIRVEIVFVDDGSKDGTWEELVRIRSAHREEVRLVKLSRNFGQIGAILAGYEVATGDAVITISSDMQDPIALMSDMVKQWEAGYEVVIAYRQSRADDLSSRVFSRIAYGVARKGYPEIPRGGFDYLLLSRRATKIILSFGGRHRFFQGDVIRLGFPTAFLSYARLKRLSGRSTWTFTRKLKYFIDLVLDSSYLPIRMMSSLGFVLAAGGLLYSVVIVVTWYRNQTPFSGWAPIMITILVVGGMIMMMLGVIGEYLWRIYDDVRARPMYIIERFSEVGDTAVEPPPNPKG